MKFVASLLRQWQYNNANPEQRRAMVTRWVHEVAQQGGDTEGNPSTRSLGTANLTSQSRVLVWPKKGLHLAVQAQVLARGRCVLAERVVFKLDQHGQITQYFDIHTDGTFVHGDWVNDVGQAYDALKSAPPRRRIFSNVRP